MIANGVLNPIQQQSLQYQMTKKQIKQQVQSQQLFQESEQDSNQSDSDQPSPRAAQSNSQPNRTRRITKSPRRNREDDNSQENQPSSKVRNFQCKLCGKKYGSPAATHTHIDKKHPEHKKHKKQLIINLNKLTNQQRKGKFSGIRMKDIDYPKIEAGCMQSADLTLWKIYNHVKEQSKRKNGDGRVQILISENQTDCFEDIIVEGSQGDRVPTQRELQIQKQFKQWLESYKINELRERVKNYYEFITFKQRKFDLQLEQQLMKFFKIEFAAKVKVQLQITAALERLENSVAGVKQLTKNRQTAMDSRLVERTRACEKQMWKGQEVVMWQIKNYYREWVELASPLLRNMMENERALEHVQAREAADGSSLFEDMF